MANYVSQYTGTQHDMYVTKQQLVDLIYPVGAIYMSVNSASPAILFGGTWVQIKDKFLLACGQNYTAGDEGGEATHTLIDDEVPTHTHTRGTMNITGQFRADPETGWIRMRDLSGAFYAGGGDAGILTGGGSGGSVNTFANFDASRAWTGETSPAGGGGEHNNMPPYLAVFVWQRTA